MHEIKIYKCPAGPRQSVRKLMLRENPFDIRGKKNVKGRGMIGDIRRKLEELT